MYCMPSFVESTITLLVVLTRGTPSMGPRLSEQLVHFSSPLGSEEAP
jgi:hypothetical protein